MTTERQILELETVILQLRRKEPVELSDQDLLRYRRAISNLQTRGAFRVNVPTRGRVEILHNMIAFRRIDNHSLMNLQDLGINHVRLLGFYWVRMPTLVGPRRVINPRTHSRQKSLMDRVGRYYELEGRCTTQFEELSWQWMLGDYYPVGRPCTWGRFGVVPIAPSSVVRHRHYVQPEWYLISPRVAEEAPCS